MKIYITGLASGYEVEHLVRLFYPMAPLTLTPPEAGEDCVWAERKPDGLLALVREHGGQETVSAPLPGPDGETEAFALASLTYDLLRRWTGIRPPWGKMTGVRPVRLIHDKRAAGWSETDIDHFFLERFDCSEQKYQMARAIADLQEPILRLGSEPKTYSLYIGIPFCPSRCSYCSFVSCNLDRDRKLVQPYVDCLCREVEEIRAQAEQAGLKLCSIYIGGGTPTSLSADQLRQLMGTVRQCFDLSRVVEYTVEAGRPDCTDAEKLAVIKEYGATRISINPQTFSDEVLAGIGRRHSAQDILDCFADARKAGHDDINMDLIAGLPGDTVEGFERSLRQAIALDPENITVHTLTLKRASRIVIEDQKENDYADVAAMLEKCNLLAEAGYADGLEPFFASSIREFLSNSNGANKVYSPINVYMALAMLAEVTDGESRQQIRTLLGSENIEALRSQAASVWNANYSNDGAVTSILANSLWLNESVNFNQATMDSLAKNYYASSFRGEMGSEEFNQALRDWINEQTGGLLEAQADGLSMDPETVMALASTIYYRAKWHSEFNEGRTEKGLFHLLSADGETVECDFMHKGGSNTYYWADQFGAVSMSLEGSGKMWFLLPDEGVAMDDLLADEQTMEFLNSNGNWENSKHLIVNMSVPKFDVVSDFDLGDGLRALGVTDVFDVTVADFSPMTSEVAEIFLSKADHAARVAIDEEGVTAAAYTVMMMAGAAAPPEEEMDFVLDRPFLFAMTGYDGLPLFVGVVNQPVQ